MNVIVNEINPYQAKGIWMYKILTSSPIFSSGGEYIKEKYKEIINVKIARIKNIYFFTIYLKIHQ